VSASLIRSYNQLWGGLAKARVHSLSIRRKGKFLKKERGSDR